MKIGEWRWISGQGYMRIEEFYEGKPGVRCSTLSGTSYWAGRDQIRGLPELEGLRNYLQSGVPRGVFTAKDLLPVFEAIHEGPLVVECTQCGAKPGDKCRWPVGGKECTHPHLPRQVAAKELKS